MTDDIVTRLRMPICGNYDDDHPSWGAQPCSSCVEAADEIERLRADIKFWQATAQTAMENTDKALAVIELHKAIKTELEKAVSND